MKANTTQDLNKCAEQLVKKIQELQKLVKESKELSLFHSSDSDCFEIALSVALGHLDFEFEVCPRCKKEDGTTSAMAFFEHKDYMSRPYKKVELLICNKCDHEEKYNNHDWLKIE